MAKLSYFKRIARLNRKRKSELRHRRRQSGPEPEIIYAEFESDHKFILDESSLQSLPAAELSPYPIPELLSPGAEKKKFNIFERMILFIRNIRYGRSKI